MMTLYDFDGAPSPRRAKMFLVEKGVKFENIQIDIRKNEQMSEAYRKINPRCTVPALVVGTGETLTENAEISAYLEAAFPDNPLLGTTPLEKANIAKWNWRSEFDGLSAVGEALRNASPNMKDRAIAGPRDIKQIPELAVRGKQRVNWFFEDINAHLQGKAFIAGEKYSVADITATVVVDFARWIKVYPLENQTALLAWHERMKNRPSYSA